MGNIQVHEEVEVDKSVYNISGARTKGSYGRWKSRENGQLLVRLSPHS